MKVYKVKVNGKAYEVELEAVEEKNGTIETKEAAPAKTAAPAGGNVVVAPISGKVLKINVKVGDTVKVGDNLCIIEAMKLENEIKATAAGTVKDIKVSVGAMVANKDELFVIG